jgi:hypothetical protein
MLIDMLVDHEVPGWWWQYGDLQSPTVVLRSVD